MIEAITEFSKLKPIYRQVLVNSLNDYGLEKSLHFYSRIQKTAKKSGISIFN